MGASASRVRVQEAAPIARAATSGSPTRQVAESGRFVHRSKSAAASAAGGARISCLSQLRPQRATRVSSPSDATEREAETTARRVMQMPNPATARRPGGSERMAVGPTFRPPGPARVVQREPLRGNADAAVFPMRLDRSGTAQTSAEPDVIQQIEARTTSGDLLADDVRAFMEPRFDANFGEVRVHTDDTAARLSARLSARAFAYRNHIFFGRGQYQPNTPEGAELLAHELTHTIQQRAVVQRAESRTEAAAVAQREPAQVQRLGLSDILDGLADLAANVPGYTLLTLIIGRNPINMRVVERNVSNLLRAFMGLIPGGEILFQVLQHYGVVRRLGDWVQEQTAAMGLTFQSIRNAFTEFTDTLGLSDLFNPSGVWRRAQDIFTPTVTRIRNFVSGLVSQAITWLKETFTQPLANFCREIPGYGLVKVMLGRDPFTNVPAPRAPINVMRAVAEFIPDGTAKVDQLVQSRGLERAYQWFITETQARNLTWARVTGTFAEAWRDLRLADVLHPIDTLRRMITLFRPLLTDLVGFARAVLMKLAEFIFAAAMGAGGNRIVSIFMRARATFNTIISNPVGFLRNLLAAIGQGVRQFMTNILTHLRNGVIAWLTGPVARAGIQMPERWDLRGIIWFVLQILGLTWPRVREKLVRLMGERPVALLEGGFQLLQEIRERGLVQALRDRVTEFFGSLRESALGAIRSFIQQRLVMAGIQQLLSLLSPVGAVIQAIIKTYTTIQFFIQRINQILDLVESIVDSISAVASGAIAQAANFVERTMARTIPVILDFLARFIGLGDVGAQVQSTIRGLQAGVDRMLDRAVDWIRRQAAGLASRALGGNPNAPPAERVRLAVAEGKRALQRFSGQRVGALVLRPLLTAIRVRHRLTELNVVQRGNNWAVRGVINPVFEDGTSILAIPEGAATDWPAGTSDATAIPIKWFKKASFYPTIRLGGQSYTPASGITLPAIPGFTARRIAVTGGNFLAVNRKIGRQGRDSESVKARVGEHLRALEDLPARNPNRIQVSSGSSYQIDHILDMTWGGGDELDNLWPYPTVLNRGANASHNQRVRVREGSTTRTGTASSFPDKKFVIKKIAAAAPTSSGDHGTTNEHPMNSGEGDIPKKL